MRGPSLASLTAAQERFAPVLTAAGKQAADLGEQLFAVVDALDSSGSLRRTLSDPAIDADAKAGLVSAVLARSDERVVTAVSGLARSRWTSEDDLGDAVEQLALRRAFGEASAKRVARGGGDAVDQLFLVAAPWHGERYPRAAQR
jgi:F-type H+-transporting ATPase subunit delta